MTLIKSTSHDPAFNLALEEYFLDSMTGDFLLLWQSEPSVVVGKFQNICEETSLLACEKAGVGVFRRGSGGGCVYHDRGGVCFSLIMDKGNASVTYEVSLNPVIDALRRLGVPAKMGRTAEIIIGDSGRKISGSAQIVRKNRVLCHGTLLFDSDLDMLHRLTAENRAGYKSKAVRSVHSEVANFKNYTVFGSAEEFMEELGRLLCVSCTVIPKFALPEIGRAAEKYRSFEWVFGMSPKFSYSGSRIQLSVERGIITSSSKYPSLVGVRMIPSEVFASLRSGIGEREAKLIVKELF